MAVALAITADGTKQPVGPRDGATENKTVARALLADLVERGLKFDDGLLVVLDGAKALSAAVREVFGDKALIQRCTLHKLECRRTPARQGQGLGGRQAGQGVRPSRPRAGAAQRETPCRTTGQSYPSAAASLREGLEEMFTVTRLGIHGRLAKTLTTRNPIESMISIARSTTVTSPAGATGRWCCAGSPRACSTPNDPSAASRATSTCPSSSTPGADTPANTAPTPNLSGRCRESAWIVTEIYAHLDMLAVTVRAGLAAPQVDAVGAGASQRFLRSVRGWRIPLISDSTWRLASI